MDDKVNFISPNGSNVRKIKYEVYQTFYDMTRPPRKGNRVISNDEKKMLLTRDPENYDFTFLTEIFADRVFNGKTRKSQFEPNDIVKLDAGEYHNQGPIETTVGRIVWNKIMIDRVGMRSFFQSFNNEVLTKKEAGKYEQALVDMLRADEIGTPAFRRYIDHRDWLGLQLNGLITTSFTSATIQTPKKVQTLRNDLFKKYEKELKDGDIVTANKIEKELIDATIKEIGDDPGFDLYNSGARGDINNHLKNLFLMRGGVLNPNTGKYEIMKTAFSEGLRKEDFTAASNSVVQGAYPKAVGTADSGYLAKQLMAGNQTEVIDEDGSDCGTNFTLNFKLEKSDTKDFLYRYIKVGKDKVLLTPKNISSFVDKEIHLFSPMFCCGDKICEKCAGKQSSKFIGLDTNKIATTLTNLNMKKFHDSTLRFSKLDPREIAFGAPVELFTSNGSEILANHYVELYIPNDFFENGVRAEDLGDKINLFGVTSIGLFDDKGKFIDFRPLKVPSWNKYFVYDKEYREVDLPGIGMTWCTVLKYLKGHKFCMADLLEDSVNAQAYLRDVTYGKVPANIPYDKSLFLWRQNQKLNNVNFGVPSVIQEVVLRSSYRYKANPAITFAKAINKIPNLTMYDYEMASIRRISQVTSTFTGITFESFDEMVTTAVNRSKNKGIETKSPLEDLFTL